MTKQKAGVGTALVTAYNMGLGQGMAKVVYPFSSTEFCADLLSGLGLGRDEEFNYLISNCCDIQNIVVCPSSVISNQSEEVQMRAGNGVAVMNISGNDGREHVPIP